MSVLFETANRPSEFLLIAVSTKPFLRVSSIEVAALGFATPTLLAQQCGARGQSGVAVFVADAVVDEVPIVTASFDTEVQTAAIAVVRSAAPSSTQPEFLARHNRLNSGDDCNDQGGTAADQERYDVELEVAVGAPLFGAISLREHLHDTPIPSGQWAAVIEEHSGTTGGDSGIVIVEAPAPPSSMFTVGGNFQGDGNDNMIPDVGNDWGAVFVQVR